MSGILSATGLPGREPVKNAIPVGDLGAGLFAVYGILSALIGREKSGVGQYIDASLLEAALGLSIWETTELWGTGRSPEPIGTANRMSAPYQAVKAQDGYLVIGAANQKLWLTFLEVLGRPELNDDPRFCSNSIRVTHRDTLIEVLAPTFATRTVHEWVDALLAAGVPAAPIYNYEQALASDHVAARQMLMHVAHPVEGTFRSLGFPVKMRGTPQQVRYPPPLLGEHSDAIRQELAEKGLLPAAGQSVTR